MDQSEIDIRFPFLTCDVTGTAFQVLNEDGTDWDEEAIARALAESRAQQAETETE